MVLALPLSLIYGFEWLVEWWCKSLSWFGGGLGGRCSGVGWFLSIWWWLVSCLDLMDCEIKNFFFFFGNVSVNRIFFLFLFIEVYLLSIFLDRKSVV